MIVVNERDEFLLTMYYCDNMRFMAFCDDDDCARIEELNECLTDKQISKLIENYNRRAFGVTYKQCKKHECLMCKDIEKCKGQRHKK
ncbi:MAG: hypothetical protein LBP40_04775 [Campylobacteraceae bacterium]|jgi:hypothetical protein|nr:hypothetical protein [Campylobacteraceae bacterium]